MQSFLKNNKREATGFIFQDQGRPPGKRGKQASRDLRVSVNLNRSTEVKVMGKNE